jgi:hypothetical protein
LGWVFTVHWIWPNLTNTGNTICISTQVGFYKCPHAFANLFLRYATEIMREPPVETCTQEFNPWLDQIALPFVINKLGGGRPTASQLKLDGEVASHYRTLPLLYTRDSDEVIEAMEQAVTSNKIKK